MSEQFDEQPIEASPEEAPEAPEEDVLTDPETGETVVAPVRDR